VWCYARVERIFAQRALPLISSDSHFFTFALPDCVLRDLEFVERHAGAQLGVSQPSSPNEADRERYLVNSLMQEAITSSQLEGAAITLEQGKEMLRHGRGPRSEAERMVLNNYTTICRLKELADQPLTVAMIHDLQRGITRGTLDRPDAAGRFRLPDERVTVVDEYDEVLHTPPPAEQLPERIERLCAFANDTGDRPYVPPIVRAMLLHLWLAYDHPYMDGNGRTARALFYWYMLKRGYWLIEFVSLSKALLAARAKYRDAFLNTESDGYDATYFLAYHLKALRRAFQDLHDYLGRKQEEAAEMVRLLARHPALNHRQHALLHHALKHAGAVYAFQSHATSHNVSLPTARADLLDLAQQGLLVRRKRGRQIIFTPAPGLAERIRREVGEGD
jgi:Fic family protein